MRREVNEPTLTCLHHTCCFGVNVAHTKKPGRADKPWKSPGKCLPTKGPTAADLVQACQPKKRRVACGKPRTLIGKDADKWRGGFGTPSRVCPGVNVPALRHHSLQTTGGRHWGSSAGRHDIRTALALLRHVAGYMRDPTRPVDLQLPFSMSVTRGAWTTALCRHHVSYSCAHRKAWDIQTPGQPCRKPVALTIKGAILRRRPLIGDVRSGRGKATLLGVVNENRPSAGGSNLVPRGQSCAVEALKAQHYCPSSLCPASRTSALSGWPLASTLHHVYLRFVPRVTYFPTSRSRASRLSTVQSSRPPASCVKSYVC